MPDLFEFAEAKRRRDEGIALAEDADKAFAERAYQCLLAIAQRQIHIHIDDLLRELHERPRRPNAMGSVWMRAIRNRVIQPSVERRPCTVDPGKHSHNYPVYLSLIRDPRYAP